MPQIDKRPIPEDLLEEAKREKRGKLKIFLGAYPGVGKTYAMLQAAQTHLGENMDVVVGIVETHGRVETEALSRGLEIIPRQQIFYRGRYFGEMDIDAVLKRKPKLVLVDELAHTNIPGSRHEKRYQDVEDLLSAGINVYTTLNIQHIESLNDVVARIARIQVRETLPDKILELASEIELIDLPPDDLVQRLRQGKVYMPEQAGRAISHFFSKGNLTALRELAMRIAAERVDAQMVHYMRAHAIPGPWPTQDRILICLNESPVAKRLVRTARRMAERQRVPWIALYMRTPHYESLPEAAKDRIAEAMRLAERLEGEVVTIDVESRIADEIIAYAHKRNVTRLLIGRQRPRRWTGWLRETVAQELLRKATRFEVTLISPEDEDARKDVIAGGFFSAFGDWNNYALAAAGVAVAAAAAYAVSRVLPLPNISLVFMTAVILVAIYLGRGPSILASILSFAAYNIFFTKPYYGFSGFRRDDLLTIVFFLLVSVIVGNLAARLKIQIQSMRQSAQRTANLYDFSRKIAAAASLEDVLWAAVHHVASTLQSSSLVLLPQKDGRLQIAAGYPPEDQLALKDWGAAEWAWEHASPAGWKSDTLPSADWLFLPMRTRRGMVGLLGVSFKERQRALAPDQWRLLETLVDQVAVAVERTNLASDIEEARLLTETEQLRSALLSSVSHDLRTPLVSILGSATTLATMDNLNENSRKELVTTILDESERLNRFVQNLLDMTRLGYGALQPKREWYDLRETCGRAVKQLSKGLDKRNLTVDIPPSLPLVHIDPVLIEQVFVNILDNAIKYTAEGGEIQVEASHGNGEFIIRVSDDGVGIPPEARNAVFDIFYRVRAKDSQIAGTGLGLSICRGIVEAHGGRISAKDSPFRKGITIEVTLPLGEAPTMPEREVQEQLSEEASVG
jgi:two-component system, OmpR family, sensor histidine kinase KdpD